MSRSAGVEVVTGEGLAEVLAGVECVIDAATGSSPDQQAATEFLHGRGPDAAHGAAKIAHERAMLPGPTFEEWRDSTP